MIEQPYLLVMTLPCFIDAEGNRYLNALWHKDLIAQMGPIRHLILAAPALHGLMPEDAVRLDPGTLPGRLDHVDLPPSRSMARTLLALPATARRLWSAIGRATVVHCNAGGWPISFGWVAVPMARLRGRFTLTNVESGNWRLGFDRPWGLKRLVQAIAFESMGRMMVNISDMATFTHAGYRDSMLVGWRRRRGHIYPASWINQGNILARERADALWQAKLADPARPLRVVFAANLLPSKGLAVLFEALRLLDRRGVAVELDLYGAGVMQPECAAAARELTGAVRITLKGTLAYGEPFFTMLDGQDVMIAPSLSDEQPRVAYDACARALPMIASDTPGIREVITDGTNARLVPIGDAHALADAIEWAAAHRATLRDYGLNALEVAAGLTHDQMHTRRAAMIESKLAERARRR